MWKHPVQIAADQKIITSPSVDGEVGSFSLESPFGLEKCRERFASLFTADVKGMYMLCGDIERIHNVMCFLTKCELVLETTPSTFAYANRSHILFIAPASFWMDCVLKRSLLTIILRCGIKYQREEDNFEEALFEHEHVKNTKNAVIRFMYGHTRYVGVPIKESVHSTIHSKGWVKNFRDSTVDFARENLVLPDNIEPIGEIEELGNEVWL